MSKFSTFVRLIRRDRNSLKAVLLEKIGVLLSDKLYLQLMFRIKMGAQLHLNNPISFNEKIQWLKLYNRNPLYTRLVDKFAIKDYVSKKLGEEYIIPTLGVWDNAEDIDFEHLPNQFVLKTTNGGGGNVVICKNKNRFDQKSAIRSLNRGLKKSIYKSRREWPYKNVPPRIIAEKYVEDKNGTLLDYKFFCFGGEVKCLQVDYDRFTEHHRNMYDTHWNLLPFIIKYPSKKGCVIEKPLNFEKMISIATLLSTGMPHVRVDLYNVDGKIYFGEMTFFHGSGYEKFYPDDWNYKFGDWLKLPSVRMQ